MDIKPQGKLWIDGQEHTPAPIQRSKFALSEMADDWHFFNHGAMFAYCGMAYPEVDPVSDWFAQQEKGTEVLMQPFKTPVFEGLESPIHVSGLMWNNVICAVRHEDWPSLLGFLGGVATVDNDKELFAQVFTGDIQIQDPVLVERYSVMRPGIPRITVTVFCADTNKDRWEVVPPHNDAALPSFRRVQPRQELVDMAEAVLGGDASALQHNNHPSIRKALNKHVQEGPG